MKLSQFFNLLSNKDECNYLIRDSKQKTNIEFSLKEITFILKEFDFELKTFYLYSHYNKTIDEYDETANILLFLKDDEDLTEILRLKQKRKNKIEEINNMLRELEAKRDLL